jgi:hypothetical protein
MPTHLQIILVLPPAAVQPTKHECLLPGSRLRLGGAPPASPQNNNNDLMQAESAEEVRVQHLPSGPLGER